MGSHTGNSKAAPKRCDTLKREAEYMTHMWCPRKVLAERTSPKQARDKVFELYGLPYRNLTVDDLGYNPQESTVDTVHPGFKGIVEWVKTDAIIGLTGGLGRWLGYG